MSQANKKGYHKGAFGEPSYLKKVERRIKPRPRDPVRQLVIKSVTETVTKIGVWERMLAFIKRMFGGTNDDRSE